MKRLRIAPTLALVVWLALGCTPDGIEPAADLGSATASTPAPTVTATTTPTRMATPTPTRTPTSTPTPSVTEAASDAAREARLEELRERTWYLELAEVDRARTATWSRFGYHNFDPHSDGELLFEWANKDELWNEIAPAIRDECLLAGRPAPRPMWDAKVAIPAGVTPVWNTSNTEGLGHVVDFMCAFTDSRTGEPAQLWAAVVIEELPGRIGQPLARLDPFVIRTDEVDTLSEALRLARDRVWDWLRTL